MKLFRKLINNKNKMNTCKDLKKLPKNLKMTLNKSFKCSIST